MPDAVVLPIRKVEEGSPTLGLVILVAGAAAVLASLVFFVGALLSEGLGENTFLLLLLTLPGLLLLYVGWSTRNSTKELTIDRDRVAVRTRSGAVAQETSTPLSEYREVILDAKKWARLDGTYGGTKFLIYLRHEDADKTILLERPALPDSVDRLHAYSKALDLPSRLSADAQDALSRR